jgi:hypothetical protein
MTNKTAFAPQRSVTFRPLKEQSDEGLMKAIAAGNQAAMRTYHEKSVEEVAEIIQLPKNTVKTRTFYARKRLAQLLSVHPREPPKCLFSRFLS